MMMNGDDLSLLRDFAAHRTEAAFATLVQRHLGLVHSAALRQTGGDAHLAADIAQKVFLLLAQKAGQLGDGTILSAWLYRSALYIAADTLKQNRRRHIREQEACMSSQIHEADTTATWQQLAPVLDETMAELNDADRTALVLRFFENKSLDEVGRALQVGEAAAHKRITRAVDKLHHLLTKKGVTLGATAITGAVAANAVSAAPAALTLSITTAALAGTVTTTLIATTPMNWISLKLIAASLTAALTVGTVTYLSTHSAVKQLQTQNDTLTAEVQSMTQERDQAAATLADLKSQVAQINQDKSELLKLRGEVGTLRQQLGQAKTDVAKLKSAPVMVQVSQPRSQTSSAPDITAMNHCINNLRQMDAAKNQFALEHRLTSTNYVTADDIAPYLMGNKLPECPSGGTYVLGRLDQMPTCSIPGHALPDNIDTSAAPSESSQLISALIRDMPQGLSPTDLTEAAAAYAQDHNGAQPHGLNQFLFYLKQPGPKLGAAVDAYKQSHNGSMPTNILEIVPYYQ
jgi:RNA polymerase sigma factor (sigma-70 family)